MISTDVKPKFSREAALAVWLEIGSALAPACDRICVAGSVRRGKEHVGDVEILYIPRCGVATPPGELLPRLCNLADLAIGALEQAGVLARRPNSLGREMFGEQNKLMRHVHTGIPVDLFATTADAWHNYLVCRTGPADLNLRISSAAIHRGWRWNPYGSGFSRVDYHGVKEESPVMRSEEAVFAFVGMPYVSPEDRR